MSSIWHLIDINHLFYRAYYGTPLLTNSAGEPTHALFGLLQLLTPILQKVTIGDRVVACLDGANNFRKEIEPLYKSNRKAQPEDLLSQRVYLAPLLEALGITVIMKDTFEADDIIGTLTRRAQVLGEQAVIYSGDKDFCQLICDRVKVFDYTKDKLLDNAYVYERYGISPMQFIDYLSLVGDSADCITGVRGIGAKGATKLLKEYGTLEHIYNSTPFMTNATVKKKLQNGFSSAKVSKNLAIIRKDVELSSKDLYRKPIDKEKLREMLVRLNFTSYLKEFLGDDVGLLIGESKL